MKILQLIHKKQTRGAEIFTCQLSNHLLDLGHQVKIVSIFDGEAVMPFKQGIEFLRASSSKGFSFSAIKKLALHIKEYQPDVVQANSGDTLKYAVLSKIIFGWKFPLVVRNASEVGRYLHSKLQRRVNGFLYQKVDRIISVSKASESDILKNFPFLNGKTEVIGVGIEKTGNIKPIQLLPLNKQHIVHVGGFSFEKNHSGLLKIFQKIFERIPTVHLHLVGDGPLRSRIAMEANELNIQEHISFHGFVTNPLSYIKSADVLVLPSIIEGLPGVLLEAMYCKTPVVAYNVGGISEIVNSQTGRIVDKGNEDKFAEEALQLLQRRDDQQIASAYGMVMENFLNEKLARKFLRSYHSLTQAKFKDDI